MILREISQLINKDLILEWRLKYALNGMILYVGSTIFICYLSFNLKQNQIGPFTWNTLFWIIMLFVAVNAIAKSFIQENEGRQLYFYSLVQPQAIIAAKIIYNSLLMILLGGIAFLIYALVLGNPVQDPFLFILNLFMGGVGFSSTLTMISSIASKTNNSSSLMAILGFPIVIPVLLMVIKVSKNALDGVSRSASYDSLLVLSSLIVIVITLSLLLFPFLWRS